MISKKDIRSYEVSIWTLQDSFITVLKTSDLEHKGQLQEPKMTLKNDGTQEFSFEIPMYIRIDGKLQENPLWYNTRNGILIADMRKIKVIFNKYTDDEAVFEFIITKVTESHEGFEKTCEVECEGLAFHELGKQGYKIELTQDIYELEYDEWIDGGKIGDMPVNNLNYWMDKVIKNSNWQYRVEMDWTGYSGDRDSDKVYEDEYVSSWNVDSDSGALVPAALESAREKYRLLDETESNRYNLTQSIAEIFEVFCRYEYVYDDNYHIKERWIIFYNNFVQERGAAKGDNEKKGSIIDFTYYYNTEEISRECDSTDVVTKMYVKVLEDENMESGQSTIMDTDANRSREDYLLNFDYLYEIGTISTEQYKEVPRYEAKMRELNMQLFPLQNKLISYQTELPEQQANETINKNAVDLDTEQISANNALKDAITNNTGVINITETNPRFGYAITDYNANDGTRCINIREQGVIKDTLHLYTKFSTTERKLSNELTNYTLNIDENGNITKVCGLPASFNEEDCDEQSRIYMTYDYDPRLYYQNIIDTFTTRLGKDQEAYDTAVERVKFLTEEIEDLQTQIDALLLNKENEIARFERTMGPALREGNWTPENDYANYGDKHIASLSIGQSSGSVDFIWDTELFDDEDKLYFYTNIDMEKKYYPCVNLTSYFNDSNFSWEKLQKASFIFKDVSYDIRSGDDPIRYMRFYAIGSKAQLKFVKAQNDTVYPVLVLYGADELSDELYRVLGAPMTSANRTTYTPQIGIVNSTVNEKDGVTTTIDTLIDSSSIDMLSVINNESDNNYQIVYPRFKIRESNVKVNATEPGITHNSDNTILKNYEEYYVLSRMDKQADNDYESEYTYYATIKPEIFFKLKKYNNDSYTINFTASNTSLCIYLDAVQVLKENAYPKVSYEIKPSLINKDFAHTAYNKLNQIAHINDPELKFEHVMGYISEIELDLDHPWDDEVKIQNYKTKFEDLFSSIVASTEEMKKNSYIVSIASRAFDTTGELETSILQGALNRVNISYAFNNGTLTITEKDGIWGISDDGVVAFRGGGIFTANEQDDNGNWIWNTGIVPSGINASLITAGQLDTNLIRIYSGDDLKFQLNGDGLYAYKSWLNDADKVTGAAASTLQTELNSTPGGYDTKQYVVHNEDGLFLIAESGSIVPHYTYTTDDKGNITVSRTDKYTTLDETVERVAISWDGLRLRNWTNQITFFASPDTGDLFISGTLNLKELKLAEDDKWKSGSVDGAKTLPDYVASQSEATIIADLDKASGSLYDAIKAASDSIIDAHTIVINHQDVTLKDAGATLYDNITNASTTLEGKITEATNNLTDTITANAQAADDALEDAKATLGDRIGSVKQAVTDAQDTISTLTNNLTNLSNDLATLEKDTEAKYTAHVYENTREPVSTDAGIVGDIWIYTSGTDDNPTKRYYILTQADTTNKKYTWVEQVPGDVNLGTDGSINMVAGAKINMVVSDLTDLSKSIFTMDNTGITIGSSGKIDLESKAAMTLNGASITLNAYNGESSGITLNSSNIQLLASSSINLGSSSISLDAQSSINLTGSTLKLTSTSGGNVFTMDNNGVIIDSLTSLSLVSGTSTEGNLFKMDSNGIIIYTGASNGGIYLVTGTSKEINSSLVSLDSNGIILHSGTIDISSSTDGVTGSKLNIKPGAIEISSEGKITIASTGTGNAISMDTSGMLIGSNANLTLYSGSHVKISSGTTTGSASTIDLSNEGLKLISDKGIYLASADTTINNVRVTTATDFSNISSKTISGSLIALTGKEIYMSGATLGLAASSNVTISSGGSIALGTVTGENASGLYITDKQLTMTGGNVFIGGSNKIVVGETSTEFTSQTVEQRSNIVVIDKYGVGIGGTGLRVITDNFKVIPGAEDATENLFFVGNTDQYLKFTGDGKLIISGQVEATTGAIGQWTIGAAIYNNILSFNETATNGAYIGTDGLIFGDGFKLHMKSGTFDYLKLGIENGGTSAENSALTIQRNTATNGDVSYSLDLALNLDEAILPYTVTSKLQKMVWTTNYSSDDGAPIFDNDSSLPLGTIGILYTEKISSGSTYTGLNGAFSAASPGYLPTALYNASGHDNSTYFNMRWKRWNVSRGSADSRYADNWSRAGVHDSTNNASATYSTVKVVKGGNADSTFTLSFNWCMRPQNASWDVWSSGDSCTNPIQINIFDSDPSNTSSNNICNTITFTEGQGKTVTDTTTRTASINVQLTQAVTKDSVLYVTFWPKNKNVTNSLIYIDQSSVVLGEGNDSATGQVGLYVKTATSSSTTWKALYHETYN